MTRQGFIQGRALLRNFFAFVLIGLAVTGTYYSSLDNGFLFDDRPNITRHAPLHVTEFSLSRFWQAGNNALLKERVLPSVTFAVDWWRGGGNAKPFIQTNILLHTVNGFLVFVLLGLVLSTRLARSTAYTLALLVALAWTVHPIQAQAITYIVQRMASMAALFSLLSLIAYFMARQASLLATQPGWYLVVVLSALAAAFSKENAWILPALLILFELGVVRADRQILLSTLERRLLYGLLCVVVLAILSVWFETGPLVEAYSAGYANRDFSLWERVLTQPRVIAFHLSQIVLPLPDRFSLLHDFSTSVSLFTPVTTLFAWGAALLWILAGVFSLSRVRFRLLGFFILWVPLTLLIESSIVPLEMIFEHRMYLPSVGLFGILAVILGLVWQTWPWGSRAVIVSSLIGIALLIASTQTYIPVWKSEWQVYQRAVQLYPQYLRAHLLYGHSLLDQRRFREALIEFRHVQRHDPEWPSIDKFIGRTLAEMGKFAAAETHLRRALETKPDDVDLLNNMAGLALQRRDLHDAEQWLRQALLLNPAHPLARANWRTLERLKHSRR